ncbi:MAG TPA: hypothetical protein VN618_09545 [Solirubrobacteraceae bacterium]|nr:hypothetical protein [Solirubrobacteraceae bacterium]
MRRQTALWALAALLGLMLAAGVSWATSTLTSQHIGLSSEAETAGRRLAPPEATRSSPATTSTQQPAGTRPPSTSTPTATTPIVTAPESETAPAPPAGEATAPRTTGQGTAQGGDDSSGHGAGGGQGRDD